MDKIKEEKKELFCGSCKEEFFEIKTLTEHILQAHNGLAKINDETPMSNKEEQESLKNALKSLKKLACKKNGCKKSFQTVGGFIAHRKSCGVPIEYIECDVCGRQVNIKYLSQHKKQAHPIKNEVKEEMVLDFCIEDDSNHATNHNNINNNNNNNKILRPRTNKSSFADIPDSLLTGEDGFDYEMDESPSQPQDLSIEHAEENGEATDKQNPEKELIKHWTGCYQAPESELKKVTREMMYEWQEELEATSRITCKTKGCNKVYTTRYGMKYHAARCTLGLRRWKCLLCGLSFVRGAKSILLHLVQNHSANESKDLILDPSTEQVIMSQSKGDMIEKGSYPPPYHISTNNARHNDPRSLKPLQQALKWTLEFHKKHDCAELFPEWKPNSKFWQELNESHYALYLPPLRESVKFKHVVEISSGEGNSIPISTEWRQLELFESLPLTETSAHLTFFVGGPVWSSAWCPVPLGVLTKQYIAFGTSSSMDKQHHLASTEREKGLIQLWDLGVLDCIPSNTTPHLALALAHNHGVAADMAWCPSGCWEDPSSYYYSLAGDSLPDLLPRLGLLAVGFHDSYVRIYSIPHPELLQRQRPGHPIYQAKAIVTLAPPNPGHCMTSWKTVCTKISWQRTDQHTLLAAGYGNGLVCIWDLLGRSPLLLLPAPSRVLLLRPFCSFIAHQSSVTGIVWVPISSGKFLSTCGIDRNVKIWDLDNTTKPLNVTKKGLMRDLTWSPHWCGTFGVMDDCYNIFSTFTFYKECGYYNYTSRVLSPHNACTWSLSMSDWLNTEVSCDAGGEVVATVLCQLLRSVNNIKQMSHRRIPLYRLEMVRLDEEPLIIIKKEPEDYPSESILPDSSISLSTSIKNVLPKVGDDDEILKHLPVKTYKETVEHYGLVIHDQCVTDLYQISHEEYKRLAKAETMNPAYPFQYLLSSVNTVCWNPNLRSHLWVFSSGQAGFARVSLMAGLHQPEAEHVITSVYTPHQFDKP